MHAAQNIQELRSDVAALGDEELLHTLRQLLGKERVLSARWLAHLAEVDVRGLYREHAYASLFDYCVQALHLSEAEAYLRIRAARLGRQFPRVLSMLAAGELHLSAIKLLAPVLTADNAEELLSVARFKSKRELELQLAQRFQQPDVSNVIRKLPQPRLVPEPVAVPAAPLFATDAPPASPSSTPSKVEVRPEPQPARPALSPLGPERYKVQLTASKALHDKLRQAQDLMRHEVPDGDLSRVLERALDLLIAERMKRCFAATDRPRKRSNEPASHTRHIPNAVRREVFARDGGRCTYVSDDGKRCEQRGFLELHHEEPFGRGGPATIANIRLLCRAHNQLLAERDYGRAHVQQRIERARSEEQRML
jgi:5-methylcytosine-specific restriction endonuclease McrA